MADRDGRIKKGDRILSINGKILKGFTHKEALEVMKAPRPEVVIVLSRNNQENSISNGFHSRSSSSDLTEVTSLRHNSQVTETKLNSETQKPIEKESENNQTDCNYKILRAEISKDVAGLGFILEGGKDSPVGDKPLFIKRIFKVMQ